MFSLVSVVPLVWVSAISWWRTGHWIYCCTLTDRFLFLLYQTPLTQQRSVQHSPFSSFLPFSALSPAVLHQDKQLKVCKDSLQINSYSRCMKSWCENFANKLVVTLILSNWVLQCILFFSSLTKLWKTVLYLTCTASLFIDVHVQCSYTVCQHYVHRCFY